jgi:hypothetical protein
MSINSAKPAIDRMSPEENRIPEPGSLRWLINAHPSTRLYLPPILWRAEHLTLLRCDSSQILPAVTGDKYSNFLRAHRKDGRYRAIKEHLSSLYYTTFHSGRDQNIRKFLNSILDFFGGNGLFWFNT